MSSKSLALAAIPLHQVRWQESDEEEEEEAGEPNESQTPRNLQMSCSPFKLPDDWIVKERLRPSCTGGRRQIDRYYYEPGTGRMFRSLVSVQRHLMKESRETKRAKSENKTKRTKSENKTKRVKSENKNTIQAETQTSGSTSSFRLPDDWIVEEKPRRYLGVIDRTYIEPKTGQRFRSLIAVQRYLNEDNGFTPTAKPLLIHGHEKQRAPGENCWATAVSKRSKVAEEDDISLKSLKLAAKSKKSGTPKKINLEKDSNASTVNLPSPPAKVKWVLSGTGGFWTPFLDGSKVPESVKQKWSNALVSYIQDGGTNDPSR